MVEDPLEPGCVREDGLPFSYVHYPKFEGIFIAFQAKRDLPPSFCEWARLALIHYFRLSDFRNYLEPEPGDFPEPFRAAVGTWRPESGADPLKGMAFAPGIRHACHRITPSQS